MKFQQVQEIWEINPTSLLYLFSPPGQREHQLFAALCGAAVRNKAAWACLSQQELELESGLGASELAPILAHLEEHGAARRVKK